MLVMEAKLGRNLYENETVHRRNGVKDDNRPANLGLWVRPQPSGIRVDDALDWARTILRRYMRDTRHVQERAAADAETALSWRWRESNPRPRTSVWVFYGRSRRSGLASRLPAGEEPLGQPGCDVRRRPPGGAATVSLLATPGPRTKAIRGGRLPNYLGSERQL
jgi:hypothetical protein